MTLVVSAKRIYFIQAFDGNKLLGARTVALKYSVENSKFDENHSKILQNHIVIEIYDLRASFQAMTLVDGAKRIKCFNFLDGKNF